MSIYSSDRASVAYWWLSIDTSIDINISCDFWILYLYLYCTFYIYIVTCAQILELRLSICIYLNDIKHIRYAQKNT